MSKVLVLEDNESRIKIFQSVYLGAIITRTAKECIDKLIEEDFDLVFLDHDLGGEIYVDTEREDTGTEVVRWLCEHKLRIEQIVVHSLNFPAAAWMVQNLLDSGYKADRVSFLTCISMWKNL